MCVSVHVYVHVHEGHVHVYVSACVCMCMHACDMSVCGKGCNIGITTIPTLEYHGISFTYSSLLPGH